MKLIKIIICVLVVSCTLAYAQELSEEEQIKLLKNDALEYFTTKIFEFNKNTRFMAYPYAEMGDVFFVREKSENYENAKKFYGTVESSIVVGLNQEYLGNETKFQISLIPILGIKVENIMFATDDNNYDGNFKLGLKIPILLFDYFNIDLDTYWSLLYYDSLKNACCVGFDLKSYFLKPLVLEGSVHIHGSDEVIPEYSAQFGFFIKSVNFFLGWKYLEGNCFYIGGRRYF